MDESGNFPPYPDDQTPDPHLALGALLARIGPQTLRTQAIARIISQRLPHVPWPPHATHLRHPMSQLVWMEAARRASQSVSWSPPADPARRDLCAHILAQTADRFPWDRAVQEATSRAGRVAFDTLNGLTPLVSAGRREALVNYARNDLAQYTDALRAVDADAGPGRLFAFAATPSLHHDPQTDRAVYPAMVVHLLERVAETLSRRGGEHCVDVHLAARHIGTYEEGMPLTLDLVTRLTERAQEAAATPNVTLRACAPLHWQGDPMGPYATDARLAIADLIANVTRSHRRRWSLDRALGACEGDLHGRVGLPLRSSPPSQSHLIATPRLHEHLRRACRDGRDAAWLRQQCSPHTLRWAIEQAIERLNLQGAP